MSNDKIKFKSGYSIYANGNTIGIDDELNVTEGWDGGIPMAQYEEFHDNDYPGPSKADMLELCDILIERWTKLKAEIEKK